MSLQNSYTIERLKKNDWGFMPLETENKHPQYINSIIRATKILELFGKKNAVPLGIAEISKELGLQKTTVFNIVKTLAKQGWLVQDTPNGKYKLGSRLLMISSAITHSLSTEDLLLQEMHQLRDRYNEDVVLTAMIDMLPVCVEKIQSSNMLRIQSRVGRLSDFLRGSTGKTLFAWQSQTFRKQYMDSQGVPDSERVRIEMELEEIRRKGYCTTFSEQDAGVASVSVPILNRDGIAEYSLAIIGEEKRMMEKGMEDMSAALMNAVKNVRL